MPDPTTPRQVGEALRQALAYDNPRFLSLRVSKHALSELLREFDALAKDHEAALAALNEYAQDHGPLPPVMGVSRDAECPKSLTVFFRREPTDDEMRALHDWLRKLGGANG